MTYDQASQALEEIMLPRGGTGISSEMHPNFTDDRVIEHLRQYGEEFSKTGLVIHRLASQSCHWNVSDISCQKTPAMQFHPKSRS